MGGHCIYIIEDLPVLKSIVYFVNNATFFSMLYHGTIEYVANTWICVYMIVE